MLTLAVCWSGCYAQLPGKKIEVLVIQPRFRPGNTYQLEVQKGKADSRKPGSEKMIESTDVELKVVSGKNGFSKCCWKYGSSRIVGFDPAGLDKKTRKLLDMMKGLEVRFVIDASGSMVTMSNYKECRKNIERSYQALFDYASSDAEARKKVLDVIRPTTATPLLIGTYCPDLNIYFSLFGEVLNTDSTYVIHSDMPNPLGGDDFPATLTTRVDSVTDPIAFISKRQSIKDEDLKAYVQQILTKFKSGDDKDSTAVNMNMSTLTRFNFDYKVDMLREVYAERHIEADNVKQVQTYRVTLKE